MFRDDDLAYALRLGQAGVPVEFHLHPGARTNSTSSPSTPPPPGAPAAGTAPMRCATRHA
jgi:acetyl esterase/lipase